jgi:CRP-like cAMP-binding protein
VQPDLLSQLDEADRAAVLARARRRSFGRNEIVFHQGDPGDSVHLIESGRVAIRIITAAGDVATVAVLSPGQSFGELALLKRSSERTATVVALEPTRTLSLQAEVFDELRRERPQVERLLVALLGERVERLSEHLVEALYVQADKRVLRRLLDLVRIYSTGEGPIMIPLTQEDLAGLAGTTRPTVNAVLRKLEQAGALALSRGRIEVLDPSAVVRKAR